MTHVTKPTTGTPWAVRRVRRPDAHIDLFCFAHAGGSTGEYVRWGDDLPDVQVWGVQLPGRASRMAEPPFTSMAPLVDAFVRAVDFDRPFALFGHSLGSLIAFEVANALRARDRPQPQRLLVSSVGPPPIAHGRDPIHDLSDTELLAEIERRWGELPSQIRDSPQALALALAQYRADFAVFETYDHVPGEPLDCPITAFVGDEEADALGMTGWRTHTTADFDLHVLPGHHFYLRQRRRELLDLIGAVLPHGVPELPHSTMN